MVEPDPQAVHQAGRGPAGAHAAELGFQIINRLLHRGFGFEKHFIQGHRQSLHAEPSRTVQFGPARTDSSFGSPCAAPRTIAETFPPEIRNHPHCRADTPLETQRGRGLGTNARFAGRPDFREDPFGRTS
jgi:hypothetical protein